MRIEKFLECDDETLDCLGHLYADGCIAPRTMAALSAEAQLCNMLEQRIWKVYSNISARLCTKGPVLSLNLGGKRVSLPREILTKNAEKNMLSKLLCGSWDDLLWKDSNGRIYLDYDHHWVSPIVSTFRLKDSWDGNGEEPSIRESNPLWSDGVFGVSSLFGLSEAPLIIREQQYAGRCPDFTDKGWLQWLDEKSRKFLESLLPGKFPVQFKYQGTRDGFRAANLRTCGKLTNKLIVVRDTEGNVFGCWTCNVPLNDKGFVRSKGYKPFIFTLRKGDEAWLFQETCRSEASSGLFNNDKVLIALGGNREAAEGFDLCIGDRCDEGDNSYIQLGNSFSNCCGWESRRFTVAEIEVYSLGGCVPTPQFDFNLDQRSVDSSDDLPPKPGKVAFVVPTVVTQPSLVSASKDLHQVQQLINEFSYQVTKCKKSLARRIIPALNELHFVRLFVGISYHPNNFNHVNAESLVAEAENLLQLLDVLAIERKDTLPGAQLMEINCADSVLMIRKQTVLDHAPKDSLLYSYADDKLAHELDHAGRILLHEDPDILESILNYFRMLELLRHNRSYFKPQIVLGAERQVELEKVLLKLKLHGIPITYVEASYITRESK